MKKIFIINILLLLGFLEMNAQYVEVPITDVEVVRWRWPNSFDPEGLWHAGNDVVFPDAAVSAILPAGLPAGGQVQLLPISQAGLDYVNFHPYVNGNGSVVNGVAIVDAGTASGSFFSPTNLRNPTVRLDGSLPVTFNPVANDVVRVWAKLNNVEGSFNTRLETFLDQNFKMIYNSGDALPLDHFVQEPYDRIQPISRRNVRDFSVSKDAISFDFQQIPDLDNASKFVAVYDDFGSIIDQYITQSSSIEFAIAEGYNISTFNSKGDHTYFSVDNFDGIDFTNLKVDGIDIDQATSNVNFILNGDQQNSGDGSNVYNTAANYKKLFLQALSIPSSEWFVSLDVNPNPLARASAAFKQTDIARIFFEADVELKNELFNHFFNSGIYQQWLQILNNSNANMLYSLLAADKNIIPTIKISGRFLPDIPSSSAASDKISINNARYVFELDLDEAFIDVNGQSLTQTQINFLTGSNWSYFLNVINNQLNTLKGIGENRINNGVIPEYKKMKEILPILVVAKWYKNSDIPNKQFEYLIDTRQTGQVPGADISPDVVWNQGYWNNQADRLLGHASVSYGSWSSDIPITGGVDIGTVSINTGGLNQSRRDDIDNSMRRGFVNSGNRTLVSSGKVGNSLPDLNPDNISVLAIGTGADYRKFPVGTTLDAGFVLRNLGLTDDYGNPEIYIENLDLQHGVAGVSTIGFQNVLSKETIPYNFSISNLPVGRYRLTITVDPNNSILERNEFNNSISIEYEVVNNDDNCKSVTYNSPLDQSGYFIELACSITAKNTITTDDEFTMMVKDKIVAKPGFNFKAEGNNKLTTKVSPDGFSFITNSSRSAGSSIFEFNDSPYVVEQGKTIQKRVRLRKVLNEKREVLSKSVYRILPENGQKKLQVIGEDHDFMIYVDSVRNKEASDFVDLQIRNIGNGDSFYEPTLAAIKTFPNPVVNELIIEMNVDLERSIRIDLKSIDGKHSQNLLLNENFEKGVHSRRFDLSHLTPGAYLISVVTDDGKFINKTIIKQ